MVEFLRTIAGFDANLRQQRALRLPKFALRRTAICRSLTHGRVSQHRLAQGVVNRKYFGRTAGFTAKKRPTIVKYMGFIISSTNFKNSLGKVTNGTRFTYDI